MTLEEYERKLRAESAAFLAKVRRDLNEHVRASQAESVAMFEDSAAWYREHGDAELAEHYAQKADRERQRPLPNAPAA